MKLYKFIIFTFFVILINGCRPAPANMSSAIIQKDYKYDKMILENYRFTIEIHLENLKDSIKKYSDVIRKLIYQNNTFDEYLLFVEDEFIGDVSGEDFPAIMNDDGTEYIYESSIEESYNIEYYNDLFVIMKYSVSFYYAGAAHGNYMVNYFIIDLTDEKILDVDDLIRRIPDEITDKIIREKYEIYDYLRENIWPPDTISFQKDSVILMWNPYTITAYAVGIIEIEIKDKIIESYFTEKGLKLRKSMNKKPKP